VSHLQPVQAVGGRRKGIPAGELRVRAERAEARAEAEVAALRDAVACEGERADAALVRALVAERELAEWTAGAPVRRALRAFLNRRERP
jgi:hypothetical protein